MGGERAAQLLAESLFLCQRARLVHGDFTEMDDELQQSDVGFADLHHVARAH